MTSQSAEILREEDLKPSNFAIAFAEWMSARAAVAQCDTKTDEQISALDDALTRAEWKLLQTPAVTLIEIGDRASARPYRNWPSFQSGHTQA